MTLALEFPPENAPKLESGNKTMTFQIHDKIVVGDVITAISGNIRRKIKITGKMWVPETEMPDKVRTEILNSSDMRGVAGFSGAFQIAFQYVGEVEGTESGAEGSESVGESKDATLSVISKHMDENL
jgi:hypothetical protein